VLLDQDVVRSGRAATEPWKFYDLGHGYCAYDFFVHCQRRMASAKCDFYMPKEPSTLPNYRAIFAGPIWDGLLWAGALASNKLLRLREE